jgi:pimeloyl-ACP methyl ester carboxylesterase
LLRAPELGLADAPVDLLGHSMGGNVVMIYAGVRPERVRRLVNLEGFGMPQTSPDDAPGRYARWLDELAEPAQLRTYDSAPHWSRLRDDGQWEILGDPAHKRANPVLYRKEEVLACWRHIRAPLLWVEGDRTDITKWWGNRFPRSDFDARLSVVADVRRHLLSPAGHMLHHDQPEALARELDAHLG